MFVWLYDCGTIISEISYSFIVLWKQHTVYKGEEMSVKKLFTTGEAAEILGISRATVARKYDKGILTGTKNPITAERMISFESVAEFMKNYNLDAPDSPEEHTIKVFLVSEDSSFVSAFQEAIGSDPRLEVTVLTHGSDALIKCTNESADILVIDSTLPDIAGTEVVRSIRRLKVNEDMKILLCSDSENDKVMLEEGADSFIVKDNPGRNLIREKLYGLLTLPPDEGEADTAFQRGRRWPRVALNVPAKIWSPSSNMAVQPGKEISTLKDISYGGAMLSDMNFSNGINPFEEFRLRIEKSGSPLENMEATSRIVRLVHSKTLFVGVEFVEISDENRKKIMKLPG